MICLFELEASLKLKSGKTNKKLKTIRVDSEAVFTILRCNP